MLVGWILACQHTCDNSLRPLHYVTMSLHRVNRYLACQRCIVGSARYFHSGYKIFHTVHTIIHRRNGKWDPSSQNKRKDAMVCHTVKVEMFALHNFHTFRWKLICRENKNMRLYTIYICASMEQKSKIVNKNPEFVQNWWATKIYTRENYHFYSIPSLFPSVQTSLLWFCDDRSL